MPETRAYKLNKQRQPVATEGMLLYYFYDRGKLSSCEVTEYQFDRLVELDTEMYNNERRAEAHKATYVKVNYRIHTDAIKENIVPTLTDEQLKYVYADEADLLNVALFGKTAVQWRRENPTLKGNIRDYATIEQLLVIANMESYNAILIEQNVLQSERLKQLNAMAISQLRVLQQSNSRLLTEGRKDKK